jgi:threonine dehydrogenase-like Zn-dependent dehydrogenase
MTVDFNRTVLSITTPRKGEAAVEQAEVTSPKEGQVLVRVTTSAVSPGTERATILGLDNTARKWPGNLGYSACGIVEATGPGVTVKPGTRVAAFTVGHREYDTAPAEYCVAVPPAVDDGHAAITSLGQIALQAVRKTRIEISEAVAVFGLGPIGLIALAFARVAGAYPVIGIDRVTPRLDLARRLGADLVLDTTSVDWKKEVFDATRNRGPAVVIESTGFAEPVSLALEIAGRFGRVALLGSTRATATIDPYNAIHRPGLTVMGAHVMAVPTEESRPGFWTWRDDATAYLDLVASGRLSLDPILEPALPVQAAPRVYNRILNWDPELMIPLFDWRRGESYGPADRPAGP